MKQSTEKEKEGMKKWSRFQSGLAWTATDKSNREHHINRVKERQKNNHYNNEKTEIQKYIRNVKRKTRYYFKLEGHKCEFCGEKAIEHHHYSIPIEFDKFNYVCHNCHIKEDAKLNNHSKIVRRL